MKILTNVTLLFLTAHGRALFSAGPDWTRLGHTRPKCHSQEFARHDSECPFTFACLAEEVGERERWGLVNFEFGIRSLTTRLSACLGLHSSGRVRVPDPESHHSSCPPVLAYIRVVGGRLLVRLPSPAVNAGKARPILRTPQGHHIQAGTDTDMTRQ